MRGDDAPSSRRRSNDPPSSEKPASKTRIFLRAAAWVRAAEKLLAGACYVHELKQNAGSSSGRAGMLYTRYTRSGLDWTARFPTIAADSPLSTPKAAASRTRWTCSAANSIFIRSPRRPNSVCGTSRPSAFAVLRLTVADSPRVTPPLSPAWSRAFSVGRRF
jgi:hypothetical protein